MILLFFLIFHISANPSGRKNVFSPDVKLQDFWNIYWDFKV